MGWETEAGTKMNGLDDYGIGEGSVNDQCDLRLLSRGTELTQCQVFFQTDQMLTLRGSYIFLDPVFISMVSPPHSAQRLANNITQASSLLLPDWVHHSHMRRGSCNS